MDECELDKIDLFRSKEILSSSDQVLYSNDYLPDIIHCWLIGNLLNKHVGIVRPTRIDLKKKELYCQDPGVPLRQIEQIPEDKQRQLVCNLLDGLYGLHHYGFVHYGLSCDNIYVNTQTWTLQISGLEYCTYDYCLNLNATFTCSPDTVSTMKYDIPCLAPILLKLWNFQPDGKVLDAICQCQDPISNTRPDIVELGRLLYSNYSPPTIYNRKLKSKEIETELEDLFSRCISLYTTVPEICKNVAYQCLNMYQNYVSEEEDSIDYINLCFYLSLNLHKIYVNPLTLSTSDEDNTDLLSENFLKLVSRGETVESIISDIHF